MCKRCKKIPIKRYFLPLCGLVLLTFIHEARNVYVLPIIFFVSSFVLFINFPKLVIFSVSKPTYFEDIFIESYSGKTYDKTPMEIREKTKNIYIWILIITSSILLSVLTEYWLIQFSEKDSLFNIIGISGGVIKIFQLINKIIAKLILFIINKIIISKRKEYKQNLIEKIKLTSLLNEEFKSIVIDCENSSQILEKIRRNRIQVVVASKNGYFPIV